MRKKGTTPHPFKTTGLHVMLVIYKLLTYDVWFLWTDIICGEICGKTKVKFPVCNPIAKGENG